MISKKNVVLLGMMGVGKTTIGKQLSKKLGKNFFDIDQIIEKINNMKINEIFEKKGEKFFRNEEESISLEYLSKKNAIISLGGGAFLNEKIRKKVLLENKSFWLTIDVETLKNRLIKNKKRPLINKNGIHNIDKLIEKRKKIYCLANYEIKCEKLTINQISDKIIELYENP
tara:strand:- start:244 stop:756 length:513 start_codon:yes stop_codon:yes gene_type:complete